MLSSSTASSSRDHHGDHIELPQSDDDDNDDDLPGDNVDLDDDQSEALGFLSEKSINHSFDEIGHHHHHHLNGLDDDFYDEQYEYEDGERVCSSGFRMLAISMTCVLIIATLALLLPGMD